MTRIQDNRAAAFAAALVFGVTAALSGCAPPQYETNWRQLRAGMTHQEVEALLGQPSSTFKPRGAEGAPAEGARQRAQAPERWQYGDTLSSLGTRAVFPEEADERTYCVFFGPDGKVTEFQKPMVGR